jgi:hypothetical protein
MGTSKRNYLAAAAARARQARERAAVNAKAASTQKPVQAADAPPAKTEEKPGYARLLARLRRDNERAAE